MFLVWMFYSEGYTAFKYAFRTGIHQGRLGIVVEEFLWSIRGSYQTIWSSPLTNAKWHSVAWPNTMTFLHRSDIIPIRDLFFFTELDLYRIMKGFNKTFATGVACWQGTLTPPDTWSCLIWDLHMFYWLRPDLFSILFRTMLFEYTSVLSQICL